MAITGQSNGFSIASVAITFFIAIANVPSCNSFQLYTSPCVKTSSRTKNTQLYATSYNKDNLTALPKGISPFEKSLSKTMDIQGTIRTLAKEAVDSAISDSTSNNKSKEQLYEIEFPPLIGGDQTKSQFDDFDNVQELDSNKDWTMQFAPLFFDQPKYAEKQKTWLIFPDTKECELARIEWQGQRYQKVTFTTIQAVVEFLAENGGGGADGADGGDVKYDAPWGAAIANGFNSLLGGNNPTKPTATNDDDDGKREVGNNSGLLGDANALDTLVMGENAPSTLNLVIQPGNGGPVEDWINTEKIHKLSPESVMVVINGALDKVRDGYYPGVFFPKLAATVDRFYNKFESVFYLKPISDKGLYGWLYRVYPEPWQVVLQTVKTANNGSNYVEDTVVYVSEDRPSYTTAISKMVEAAQLQQTQTKQ